MRASLAMITALAFSLLLAAPTAAKGEEFSAVIGPIDDGQAGTPSTVTVQVTLDGRTVTASDLPAYLSFFEPVSHDVVDVPLRYDATVGAYVAEVNLPHAGRWSVVGVLRWDATHLVAFGRTDGTRSVTVAAAPVAGPIASAGETAAPAVGSALIGATAASAAWLIGLAAYALRRRPGRYGVSMPS